MPIAKWYCSHCKADVPLDHFATTECGERVHPDFCAAILGDRDSQHVKGAVRVTHGLGCPRRAVIEHIEDYAVDPLDCNAMLTGTAWHAFIETHGNAEHVEQRVSGVLAGVTVTGKSDNINGDVVSDWKHVSDDRIRYIENEAKPEHRAQLSIYAELAEQSGRQRPTRGMIWHHTSKAGAKALIPVQVKLMSINEVLEFKPHDGEFTVGELYQQADAGFKAGDWKSMPLAGQAMRFGMKTLCDFCSVRGLCTEADNGLAPF